MLSPQAQKVLQILREMGPRGVHTFELRGQHYIGNPSQRIAEIEAEGHIISHVRERLHGKAMGARYRLEQKQGVSTGPVGLGGPSMIADTDPVETSLFDVATVHRPRPHWDEAA